MPTELEAKIPVEAFEPLYARLAMYGARRLGRATERTIVLDRDGELRARGHRLRVRSYLSECGAPIAPRVAFKGPKQAHPAKLKSRDEVEVAVDGVDDTLALLGALGYREVFRYEKDRESWALADCRVELDDVPGLGRFVEVEGPTFRAVREVLERLRLDAAPREARGYVGLLRRAA